MKGEAVRGMRVEEKVHTWLFLLNETWSTPSAIRHSTRDLEDSISTTGCRNGISSMIVAALMTLKPDALLYFSSFA